MICETARPGALGGAGGSGGAGADGFNVLYGDYAFGGSGGAGGPGGFGGNGDGGAGGPSAAIVGLGPSQATGTTLHHHAGGAGGSGGGRGADGPAVDYLPETRKSDSSPRTADLNRADRDSAGRLHASEER